MDSFNEDLHIRCKCKGCLKIFLNDLFRLLRLMTKLRKEFSNLNDELDGLTNEVKKIKHPKVLYDFIGMESSYKVIETAANILHVKIYWGDLTNTQLVIGRETLFVEIATRLLGQFGLKLCLFEIAPYGA